MSPKSPDPYDVVVGQNIRLKRNARGLSQTDLAEKLGLTFQQVQKYEKGLNRVGAGRLVRIAEILVVPVMTLLEGTAAASDGGATSVSPHPPSTLALIAARQPFRMMESFSRISDKRVRRALAVLVHEIARSPES
jgi:transcriptional regulator with XRE-family HTH domain